ncbi:MAG: hypothetical protein D6767_08360, partial [Candidatus Hydrogenedentota bacterium]
MNFVSINGTVYEQDATISVFDAGFYFGFSVYDTMLVLQQKPVFYQDHLERLQNALKYFEFPVKSNWQVSLKKNIESFLTRSNPQFHYRLRILITPGKLSLSSDRIEEMNTVLFLSKIEKQKETFSFFVDEIRKNADSTLPAFVKITSANKNLLSALRAKRYGADESLLLNQKGYITEGSFSNVFWIKNGILFTPAVENNLLAGITRSKILECAQRLKMPVQEGNFKLNEILKAEECFLSSSTRGPAFVSMIRDKEKILARFD